MAVTRDDVARYLDTLFLVYTLLIFVRILLSWVPTMPYNPVLRGVVQFVHDVTDPFLNIFRRIIPPLAIGPGAIDLSPIVAIIVLSIVQRIVVGAIA